MSRKKNKRPPSQFVVGDVIKCKGKTGTVEGANYYPSDNDWYYFIHWRGAPSIHNAAGKAPKGVEGQPSGWLLADLGAVKVQRKAKS